MGLFLVPLWWPAVARQGIVGNSLLIPCRRLQQGTKIPCHATKIRPQAVGFAGRRTADEKIFPWFPCRQGNSRTSEPAGNHPLQRELAGDEEQCRRQCEAQDRVGNTHRHIAADDDPRQ